MYLARFSYDVLPVHRQRAMDFIRREVAAAGKAGDDVKLTVLEGGDHFVVIDPRSAEWPQVEKAVLELI